LAARAFGIRVEKFYIFFDFGDKKIFSFKRGDTEYGIGWFPLGGYVKIAGMIDESNDKEFLGNEPEPDEFRSKPAWQRFIVMIGGVVMNVILGIIIFTFHLMVYEKGYMTMDSVTDGIYAYDLARQQGFQSGDKIITIDGEPFKRIQDATSMRVLFGANVLVDRNGEQVNIPVSDGLFKEIESKKGAFISNENFPVVVDSVIPETPAALAGVQKGDQIISINGTNTPVFGSVKETLATLTGQAISIGVMRNGQNMDLSAQLSDKPVLGFTPQLPDYEPTPYSIASAFRFGLKDGWDAVYFNAVGLGKLFSGSVKATESVQSPIGIAKIYGGTWEWGRFWKLTGLISFILAFMNILPIPALDGGHIVFIIIEMIRGKPVSDKVLENAQIAGMVMLLGIMAFAFGNDIFKMFK
jgi:regulator of sigma E protease